MSNLRRDIFVARLVPEIGAQLAHAAIVDAIRAGSELADVAAPSEKGVLRFVAPPSGDGVQLRRITDNLTQAVLDDDGDFLDRLIIAGDRKK